ncbi:MAG: ribonuclease domain-containing protein [Planctomycetia bacterium]|nr:ribonuclease domain-containing protein [Planctomycetia bacterium]
MKEDRSCSGDKWSNKTNSVRAPFSYTRFLVTAALISLFLCFAQFNRERTNKANAPVQKIVNQNPGPQIDRTAENQTDLITKKDPAADEKISKDRSDDLLLPPIAYPFTESTRLNNAIRAARKIVSDQNRITVDCQGETADLTQTIERIASGTRDEHRNDGTEFRNRERRLPKEQNCYYTEFVHRIGYGRSPGAHRIIIGQAGDIWYTPDHYQSFFPVNGDAKKIKSVSSSRGGRG